MKVKRLIRDYVDANIAHIKATNVRNTCEIFVKGGIAFNDVFDDAKNLTAKMKPFQAREKARIKLQKQIMYMKLMDARRAQLRAENVKNVRKNRMSKFVRKGTYVRSILMKEVKCETEELWKLETDKSKNKFKHCKEKQKKKVHNEESIVKGVAVGDDILENIRKENNVDLDVETYGGATVSENEKELLKLPPDHSIYPQIILSDIEVELEKGFVKDVYIIQ